MRYLALIWAKTYRRRHSDALGMLARPLEAFRRTSRKADFPSVYWRKLTVKNHCDGAAAQHGWIREPTGRMGQRLCTALAAALPVHFWDEPRPKRLPTSCAPGNTPTKERIDAAPPP